MNLKEASQFRIHKNEKIVIVLFMVTFTILLATSAGINIYHFATEKNVPVN
jgi:hypothetical protein